MHRDGEEPVIVLKNLTKQYKVLNRQEGLRGSFKDLFSRDYKIITAVDSIDLEIKRGKIVGFLGPNGAGKSTTIKMMTGVLMPTSGTILVNQNIPHKNRTQNAQNIGVVFGQRSQLWWSLPAIESFHLLREIYCIDKKDYERKLDLYTEFLGDDSLFHKPVRQMSLGQRTLCDIFSSFLHNPSIVFLDEPTIGLDVTIKFKIRQLIKKLNEIEHTTVILTTHDMGDIEALCEKIVIIDNGKIIFNNSIGTLKGMFDKYEILKFDIDDEDWAGRNLKDELNKMIEKGFSCEEPVKVNQQGKNVSILVNAQELKPLDVLKFLEGKISVLNLEIKKPDLEMVINKIYEGESQC